MMSVAKNFRVTLLAALLGVALSVSAGDKTPRMQRLYMFGFGASLTDSVACQTQVQAVDSAWIDAHQMLVDRSLYSIQLQFHIEQNEGVNHPICTVYFDKNERKMRKLWAKLKRRYEAEPNLRLRQIDAERFRFKAEQFNPILTDDTTETTSDAADQADKKTKKGRKGKRK